MLCVEGQCKFFLPSLAVLIFDVRGAGYRQASGSLKRRHIFNEPVMLSFLTCAFLSLNANGSWACSDTNFPQVSDVLPLLPLGFLLQTHAYVQAPHE